jgi:hypothetical protein
VAIAKTKTVDSYGIDAILEPFMESVKELETGTVVNVKGKKTTLYGTLVIVSADNLAAHLIGGYKSLHAAFRKCRYSMITSEDIGSKFTANEFTSRTRETHAHHIQGITDFFATNGGERNSIFNESAYFNVTEGIPPDIMHDVLEGTLQYEVKLPVRHFIQSNPCLFRLDNLNESCQILRKHL